MIELIFVIVILGILASVAIPRLASTRTDAEISSAVANIRTFLSDISAYSVVKGDLTGDETFQEFSNIAVTTRDAKISAGSSIKVGGTDCIKFSYVKKATAADGKTTPAYVKIESAANNVDGVCKSVQEAKPVKDFLDGQAVSGQKGSVAIGSNTSVYGSTGTGNGGNGGNGQVND